VKLRKVAPKLPNAEPGSTGAGLQETVRGGLMVAEVGLVLSGKAQVEGARVFLGVPLPVEPGSAFGSFGATFLSFT